MLETYKLAPSPLQEITHSLCTEKGIRFFIKRDDLLHPIVSGNKWRKLCYNLLAANQQNKSTLLTFGGAYSNHIHAVAGAGRLFDFKTIGLIRGEEPANYGATLAYAKSKEMKLRFISRISYRSKEIPKDIDLQDCYLLPEGGTNDLAIKGCGEIVRELLEQQPNIDSSYICASFGTGGTLAGIIHGLNGQHQVIGFSALKGNFMKAEIVKLLLENDLAVPENWTINADYHFGGYAKFKPELIEFIKLFYEETQVPLDPVYTGKMAFGIFDLMRKDYFPRGSTVVMIHTGGLQGIVAANERFGFELPGGTM
ncbi:MAG: 1-aminocyclopropane-1-carboxylate deaminase/D-cysteine desulfhydrase [Saprospiraceae bacterium]